MSIITSIPSFLYLFIAYNVIIFTSDAGISAELFAVSLISGANLTITTSDLLIIFGVAILFIEVVKSTRTSTASVIEHVVSMLLFTFFLVEFIVVKGAGTATFLILTLMQLLDVIAGFTISVSGARRDVSIDSA
ncbi:MAG: hypothetical protein GY862_30170 [Gammaproteobacteria bacterium]|nr:hypothetical protein [Gammaproteobacteria bacterium]